MDSSSPKSPTPKDVPAVAADASLKPFAIFATILLFSLMHSMLPNHKLPGVVVLTRSIVVGLGWTTLLSIRALPSLDFEAIYGPLYVSVGLMTWAFVSGLMRRAAAHFSSTRYTLRLARASQKEA